jgi:hypothetical protein
LSDEAALTHALIRAHYLALPGRDEAGWDAVRGDPRKFNRVWRHLLRLPPGDDPPALEHRWNGAQAAQDAE